MLQDHVDAAADAEARVDRLTAQIAALLPGWSLAPVVEAGQASGPAWELACTAYAFQILDTVFTFTWEEEPWEQTKRHISSR